MSHLCFRCNPALAGTRKQKIEQQHCQTLEEISSPSDVLVFSALLEICPRGDTLTLTLLRDRAAEMSKIRKVHTEPFNSDQLLPFVA